ncbi:EAL domain-containing protein [Aeromonas lusitana]|uniref:Diguanylate phosphodiesterase n=1 Tax=Aeromonas lusitana TaxID=931529 RepID=A0A2M8HDE6_9GAMM|nr:EAL domain-containing protein [Aeromonas lusitana]PJC94598.1 diguanylate phosphodiesterase [Aeromonas lusitana]
MKRLSPLWISLLLFALPILVGLSLNRLAGDLLAHHLLKQKRLEIEAAMDERQRALEASIGDQLTRFSFDCGEQDMILLRDPKHYSRHIRLQGLKLASGKGCSSLGPDLPIIDVSSLPDPAVDTFGLTATTPEFNTEQELVIFSKQKGNIAYWVLSNSWSHTILEKPCLDCFYLELIPLVPGISRHELFPRGDKRIKDEAGSQRIIFTPTSSQIQQVLWAGKALQQYALAQAQRYAIWIGAMLGALLLAGYWLLRNYRRSLKGLLHTGLVHQEFVPFYQPIIDSRTRVVVGFEALLRWERAGDLTSPGAFIAYAEEQGLILPMTEQLLGKVIEDLPQLMPEQWVSVNLVAAHIEHPHLRNQLQRHDWPSPARLTFELTEREPIRDIQAAISEITLLQEKGYHFKLDDFGTGYGGFAYLQRLGIRQIKIDKMFIDTIGTDDPKRNLLDAIIAFGRKSDMEMIAEGVETQAQVNYLALHGVYLIQGYLFARPMPLHELLQWQQLPATESA